MHGRHFVESMAKITIFE